jgi:hypothetical protein
MQKEAKNFLSLGLLMAGMIFLAGCGAKNTPVNAPMQKTTQTPAEKAAANTEAIKTPAPTGKVDATVDAIISGAEGEKTQVTSDEADVKAMTDDSADSNNLSQTYEQEL